MSGVQQEVHAVGPPRETREDPQRREEGQLGLVFGLRGEQPGGGRRGALLAGPRGGREAERAGVTGARGARRAAPDLATPVIARCARAATVHSTYQTL